MCILGLLFILHKFMCQYDVCQYDVYDPRGSGTKRVYVSFCACVYVCACVCVRVCVHVCVCVQIHIWYRYIACLCVCANTHMIHIHTSGRPWPTRSDEGWGWYCAIFPRDDAALSCVIWMVNIHIIKKWGWCYSIFARDYTALSCVICIGSIHIM